MTVETWHASWHRPAHAQVFDFRHELDDRNLVRAYETLNDVRLLRERVPRDRALTLLEVGCATGDFYRYLRLVYPAVAYAGVDISDAAIERARSKHPQGRFEIVDPDAEPADMVRQLTGRAQVELVYSKDVAHHQLDPIRFIERLVPAASEAVLVRCRTRDAGPTEYDPSKSRQFVHGAWVPYIILNLDELIARLKQAAPSAELTLYRHRQILAGRYGRDLPVDCADPATGTAETAVGIWLATGAPGRVTVADRVDNRPNTTWDHKLRSGVKRLRRLLGRGA